MVKHHEVIVVLLLRCSILCESPITYIFIRRKKPEKKTDEMIVNSSVYQKLSKRTILSIKTTNGERETRSKVCRMKKVLYWAWGLENCFSIQLYSFHIFFPFSGIFFPVSLSSFLCLSSLFSFHSNENHLNIIVIFFPLADRIIFSPSPAYTYIQFTVIQNGWIFLSSFCYPVK